jgi:hypothetical protein
MEGQVWSFLRLHGGAKIEKNASYKKKSMFFIVIPFQNKHLKLYNSGGLGT